VFITGSDVRFHPGWLDHAQQAAFLNKAKVVATNDLLNDDVRGGRLATHPLIATDYIRDVLVPLRQQYEGWRHERRTNDDAPAPAAAATGGRNVPQVYDDSDDVI
jgi:hypothetical protein